MGTPVARIRTYHAHTLSTRTHAVLARKIACSTGRSDADGAHHTDATNRRPSAVELSLVAQPCAFFLSGKERCKSCGPTQLIDHMTSYYGHRIGCEPYSTNLLGWLLHVGRLCSLIPSILLSARFLLRVKRSWADRRDMVLRIKDRALF
eukprot:scaffold124246_cov35-Tisochrysis_lutea.AAC.2